MSNFETTDKVQNKVYDKVLYRLAGETPIATLVRDQLAGALDDDAAGRPILALTLPDREVLDGIARSLASLLPGPSALRAAVN